MLYEEAVQKILEYKEITAKTQTEIAKELDISNSQMSQFLNGAYKSPHIIIPKIEQFFEMMAQKEVAPQAPKYKETSTSSAVYKLIEYCHVYGKIGVAYGDAGVGKTMAVLQVGLLTVNKHCFIKNQKRISKGQVITYIRYKEEKGVKIWKSKKCQLTKVIIQKEENKI